MTDIRKNEDYTVEITGMTHEGQGVGRINGFTVFVDGALPGETAEIKIIKLAKSYGVGKLLKITKAAAARVKPFCASYPRCGGCGLQHMHYEEQLRFKTNTVRDAIKRIGKLEDVIIHDTLGMENPMNYRNKAQYPVGHTAAGPAIGFYANRSHHIIPNDICGIQSRISDTVKSIVWDFIKGNDVSLYNEVTGEGLVRHVITRTGFKTGEIMVVIVINGKDLPRRKELVKKLTGESLPEDYKVKSIYININTKNTNIILGEKSIKIFGGDTISDYIGKFKFNISPLSFFQVNPLQTEVLYGKALEYAQLTGTETVFDLYCGIGTITLFLSQKARKVYGIEVVEEAIADARKNAEINRVENVEFIVGEAEKAVPSLYSKGVKADVVVVDPPRKGCDEALLKTLVDMAPKRIVYVSCNPSTLARDLG
ncbi:MAG: 23S rRNA (uracil(1939)-C(5))-methyltransferase RlmD, partial [Clostridia bacterium]|nr:23S rRNA (uracil(1939)-C(5))-methyltransferase RlmD [Clostridia bacterium]